MQIHNCIDKLYLPFCCNHLRVFLLVLSPFPEKFQIIINKYDFKNLFFFCQTCHPSIFSDYLAAKRRLIYQEKDEGKGCNSLLCHVFPFTSSALLPISLYNFSYKRMIR